MKLFVIAIFFTTPCHGFVKTPALVQQGRPQHGSVFAATPLETAFDACKSDITKTCKINIGESNVHRLGLVATENIRKGDTLLAMPYDDRFGWTATLARSIFKGVLPDAYDGWTGDAGLIALALLNEVARTEGAGINQPKRPEPLQQMVQAYLQSLPTAEELSMDHPYFWTEEEQEALQSSSTNKIYRALDDLEEDAAWLEERVWLKDATKFPSTVENKPCFSPEGYKWAMAIVLSRSVFCDGALRLIPILDFCNHKDSGQEVTGGTMGTFGTTKGATLVATRDYKVGDEVFCSYGPKSSADYVLEHGFAPVTETAVSELSFEVSEEDRFYDDKMDILEFETYDLAPMEPVQSFDLVSGPGRDGEPDPAMIQFLRLCELGATDAFLLEALFRKEVWEFMAFPVSEVNEFAVVDTIINACQNALSELQDEGIAQDESNPKLTLCKRLRESEIKALSRTSEYLAREKEALDLKEYYQERRLKDLGLDSEWTPEDDMSADLGFGQTRVPGGADYDW